MSFRLTRNRDVTSYGVVSYIVDQDSDINTLPTDHEPGSTAVVAGNSDLYILNNQHRWVYSSGSSGGGGGSNLPPVGPVDNGKVLKVIDGSWDVGEDAAGVTDIRVGGNSIVNDGLANIPLSDNGQLGLVSGGNGGGITTVQGFMEVDTPDQRQIAMGQYSSAVGPKFIKSTQVDQAAFYGLALAAGDLTQAITDFNQYPVGTYTENALDAIRTMLGIIFIEESDFELILQPESKYIYIIVPDGTLSGGVQP